MKSDEVAGTLKLDLASFREVAAFAQFGSDLDALTQSLLLRGTRLVELLKQPQFQPMPVEREVASIFCGTNGYLDDVPESEVARFESEFLQYLDRNHVELLSEIAETGMLGDELLENLHAAVKTFKENWSDTTPEQPQVEEVTAEEVTPEEATTEEATTKEVEETPAEGE